MATMELVKLYEKIPPRLNSYILMGDCGWKIVSLKLAQTKSPPWIKNDAIAMNENIRSEPFLVLIVILWFKHISALNFSKDFP